MVHKVFADDFRPVHCHLGSMGLLYYGHNTRSLMGDRQALQNHNHPYHRKKVVFPRLDLVLYEVIGETAPAGEKTPTNTNFRNTHVDIKNKHDVRSHWGCSQNSKRRRVVSTRDGINDLTGCCDIDRAEWSIFLTAFEFHTRGSPLCWPAGHLE